MKNINYNSLITEIYENPHLNEVQKLQSLLVFRSFKGISLEVISTRSQAIKLCRELLKKLKFVDFETGSKIAGLSKTEKEAIRRRNIVYLVEFCKQWNILKANTIKNASLLKLSYSISEILTQVSTLKSSQSALAPELHKLSSLQFFQLLYLVTLLVSDLDMELSGDTKEMISALLQSKKQGLPFSYPEWYTIYDLNEHYVDAEYTKQQQKAARSQLKDDVDSIIALWDNISVSDTKSKYLIDFTTLSTFLVQVLSLE